MSSDVDSSIPRQVRYNFSVSIMLLRSPVDIIPNFAIKFFEIPQILEGVYEVFESVYCYTQIPFPKAKHPFILVYMYHFLPQHNKVMPV